MFPAFFSGKCGGKSGSYLLSATSYIVFLFLDFFDSILCIFYRFADEFIEGNSSPPCYCYNRGNHDSNSIADGESQVSETLFGRKNVFREMGFLHFLRKWDRLDKRKENGRSVKNRWSDCGCDSCVSWMIDVDPKLHFVLNEPSQASVEDCGEKATDNVIFLHGFLCSSSFWTETVFPNISPKSKHHYRLFAIDLLGFGRSPKPRDCLYTLSDHLEMIEKSVICPFQLKSFHLVAHSMGCIIGLALAAKYSKFVKSITLVAPPYFPSSGTSATSFTALERLAEKRLLPPLLFGASFMSWYEHLGRCICFFVCRHHRTWEWILKLLTRRRELPFGILDFTRHTHHSAWHSMHNVICGGSKLMDKYLESLNNSGVKINVIQGNRDQVVPLECSSNIKMKAPNARISIVPNADHITVIYGREKGFVHDLEQIWMFG